MCATVVLKGNIPVSMWASVLRGIPVNTSSIYCICSEVPLLYIWSMICRRLCNSSPKLSKKYNSHSFITPIVFFSRVSEMGVAAEWHTCIDLRQERSITTPHALPTCTVLVYVKSHRGGQNGGHWAITLRTIVLVVWLIILYITKYIYKVGSLVATRLQSWVEYPLFSELYAKESYRFGVFSIFCATRLPYLYDVSSKTRIPYADPRCGIQLWMFLDDDLSILFWLHVCITNNLNSAYADTHSTFEITTGACTFSLVVSYADTQIPVSSSYIYRHKYSYIIQFAIEQPPWGGRPDDWSVTGVGYATRQLESGRVP